MGKINVLDKHVAELIAAGEVVERPSSVIKELVENSIDSGATSITVEIQNGGITLMRVTDNGSGIMKDDIRNAFLRHATSKVKEQSDLDSIGTLGFRGEALASVAAVAKVDLITKAKEDTTGSHYVIHGCDEILFEDAGCPQGTTIVVKELFYNVPARMKFLKKNIAEANAVAAVMDKIALSHSNIAFTFIREGKKVLVTSGDGKLKNCIYSVYGREFTQGIIPVDYELNGVTVQGYVSKPQAARSSRAMQTFFINGRFVKSRTAQAALEEAYKGMIMVGKFPACVLHINLSLNAVDVNVHPAKIEVRFVNERPIFDAVYHGVKSALIKGDTPKQFNLENERLIDRTVVQKPFTMSQYTVEKIKDSQNIREIEALDKSEIKSYNAPQKENSEDKYTVHIGKNMSVDDRSAKLSDVTEENSFSHYGIRKVENPASENETGGAIVINSVNKPAEKTFEKPYANIDITVEDEENADLIDSLIAEKAAQTEKHESEENTAQDFLPPDNNTSEPVAVSEKNNKNSDSDTVPTIIPVDNDSIRYIGEAFSTYIIIERNSELVFIDKHAAHERMIYEKLKREQGKKFAQYLLEPCAVTLSKEQYSAVLDKKDVFMESGFEVDDFGRGTVLVRSAPSFLQASDIPSTIEEMAGYIVDSKQDITSEYTDWLYHNIACRSAIKGGDLSSPEELIRLVKRLDEDVNYKYCPHGRPTSVVITKKALEKQFGRM